MRISDWSSDVCSSDLAIAIDREHALDIGAVDLDEIDGERLEIGKRCRAGAEIVQADPVSVASKLLQHGFGMREIVDPRSEEHTSELQSLMRISYAVFCLKNKTNKYTKSTRQYT